MRYLIGPGNVHGADDSGRKGGNQCPFPHSPVSIKAIVERLPYNRLENHLDFLRRVSAVVNYPTAWILIQFRNGSPWIFPLDLGETGDVAIQILRGGMQIQEVARNKKTFRGRCPPLSL